MLPLTTCCWIRDFLSVCRKSEWVPIFPQPPTLISARHRAVCQALYCTHLTPVSTTTPAWWASSPVPMRLHTGRRSDGGGVVSFTPPTPKSLSLISGGGRPTCSSSASKESVRRGRPAATSCVCTWTQTCSVSFFCVVYHGPHWPLPFVPEGAL